MTFLISSIHFAALLIAKHSLAFSVSSRKPFVIPAIFVGSVFVLYFVTTGSAVTALYEIMAGGLFLGAIFMATDYQTSPINNKGKAFFALGCGILTFVIREYCAYPEGVSLSILVMNILAPMIEKWTAATPLGLGGPKNAK